jgi:excisionase family DNA binding protein
MTTQGTPSTVAVVSYKRRRSEEEQMDEKDSLTLDVQTAARRLGISRNGAYEAIRRGEIPTIRIGRRLLIPRLALEKMLAAVGTPAEAR